MSTLKNISLRLCFLAVLVSICEAGSICGDGIVYDYQYHDNGCCGVWNHECCASEVVLIAWLFTASAGIIACVIVLICFCCRRQRNYGFVARTTVAQPVVSCHSQVGMISTAGTQPGLAKSPKQPKPANQPYPANQGYSNSGFTMPNQSADNSGPKPPAYDTVVDANTDSQQPYNYGTKN